MANILKELFRREGKDNSSATNERYEIGVDAKNVILSSEEDDKREAYTNLADKLKIFNKMNNIRLTTAEDLKKIGNASGELAHAEGVGTIAGGAGSHAEGHNTEASNQDAHAEGYTSIASGYASHAEGTYFGTLDADDMQRTVASGPASHAEGTGTQAKGGGSHSEGVKTVAEGEASHAEGSITQALAKWSHAEGVGTTVEEAAKGGHAEGRGTVAGDEAAHAEGFESKALGYITHAEGWKTEARAQGSHTEGLGTIAAGKYQHVQGKYNVEDIADSNGYGQYAHIVGWGASDQRANIHTLSTKGDAYFAGNINAGKENENSEIKGNLVVDGKITAKMGLVNESGSEDFKTENLQVDNKIVLGEGHRIEPSLKTNYVWDDKYLHIAYDGHVNREPGITAMIQQGNFIFSGEGLPQEEPSTYKTLIQYRGVLNVPSSAVLYKGDFFIKDFNNNQYMGEAIIEETGTGANLWIIEQISFSNMIDFLQITIRAEAVQNKEIIEESLKGFLITGQYGKKTADDNYIYVVGGGTSEEDRQNIYTLDWDGNAEFAGNIIFKNQFGKKISVQDMYQDMNTSLYYVRDHFICARKNDMVFLNSTGADLATFNTQDFYDYDITPAETIIFPALCQNTSNKLYNAMITITDQGDFTVQRIEDDHSLSLLEDGKIFFTISYIRRKIKS